MQLIKALRIQCGDRVAIVGAGGKTSAMFTIARQSTGPVVITTTTHLSVEQTGWGDHRWQLSDIDGFEAVKPEILKGGIHVLLGGTPLLERVTGPSDGILEAVHTFCLENRLTLLVEADGSKMLPLKAPGPHEPVIPIWADVVVVCIGLSAVGSSLDAGHVHRAELFAQVSSAQPDDMITIEHIKRALLSQQGGLKGIPGRARRIALFNQADTASLQARVQGIAAEMLPAYDAAVVSRSSGQDPAGYDVLDALAIKEKCAGIILAAGKSSRLGEIKQLLDWHGKPFLWHIVQAALRAELDPVCVITGAESEKVEAALSGLPVQIIQNPDWQMGQSTSVRSGIEALPASTGSAIFLMSDQPQIEPLLLQSLVEKHSLNLSPVVAPLIDGRRGNPVLFDRVTFNDLKQLQGDTGGRAIFSKYDIEWLPWSDARMLMDVDTPEDYQKLLRMDEE